MRLFSDDSLAIIDIWMEARGEPFEGKVAVGEIILRRTAQKFQSDGTIVGTVLRPFAFSGFNTPDPNRIPAFKLDDMDPVVAECMQAWETAKAGSKLTGDADSYYAPRDGVPDPKWVKAATKVCQIGRHVFYKVRA